MYENANTTEAARGHIDSRAGAVVGVKEMPLLDEISHVLESALTTLTEISQGLGNYADATVGPRPLKEDGKPSGSPIQSGRAHGLLDLARAVQRRAYQVDETAQHLVRAL